MENSGSDSPAPKTSNRYISDTSWPIGVGFGPLGPLADGLYFGPLPVNCGLLSIIARATEGVGGEGAWRP
jgi:hypothetical protein